MDYPDLPSLSQQPNKMTSTTSVQNMFSLEGHTALITGATRGIGQAVAIALAEAGADILLVQVCPSVAF